MNNIDIQYQVLLNTILEYGVDKKDRTGTGTKSIFGYTIRHNVQEGFPLLTTKKMAVKSMMTELKWFLKGDTNIKYLVDNGCNIWNGDAYKNYFNNLSKDTDVFDILTQDKFIEKIKSDNHFAQKWGELGPIYGKQWVNWGGFDIVSGEINEGYNKGMNQIQSLIHDLKTNPDSRRLMVSAWNVGELNHMVLPPCHYGFQVYTRELNLDERIDIYNGGCIPMNQSTDYFHEHMDMYGIPSRAISLMWNQRSVDTFLGLPFNIASYATLLLLIANEVDMMPEFLVGNLGDTHLYSNHLEQAKEQINRDPYHLPQLAIKNSDLLSGEFEYELLNYESHPSIKAPLSN